MKKFLISLLISLFWFLWFWYCFEQILNNNITYTLSPRYNTITWYSIICSTASNNNVRLSEGGVDLWAWVNGNCYYLEDKTLTLYNRLGSDVSITFKSFVFSDCSCPSCPPQLTSEQCQSEYNLIPISSINQDYCINNNYCPVVNTWDIECPWEWQSRLLINWIDQDSSNVYQVNIPDYLSYDYVHYSDEVSDLNIEWYNEDQDYINWIIDTQNYKPTSEDFTSVFMNIIPYMKIIIFILFLMLVWKMLKKVFK